MEKFTKFELEKNGNSWIVSVPYYQCPHFSQNEYDYEDICIVENGTETTLSVMDCLVSDNGEFINFMCYHD